MNGNLINGNEWLLHSMGHDATLVSEVFKWWLIWGMFDKIAEKIAERIRLQNLQAELFGVNHPTLIIAGTNKWHNANYPNNPELDWGVKESGMPLPPFDMKGARSFWKNVPLWHRCQSRIIPAAESEKDLSVDCNRLVFGGFHIQRPEVKNSLEAPLRVWKLPYDFVEKKYIDYKHLTNLVTETPNKVQRMFVDVKMKPEKYLKDSNITAFVVDTRKPKGAPLGPYIKKGRVTKDVIILTVVPLRENCRQINIKPCYGGASLMGDILRDIKILEQISKVVDTRWPYFEAVFTCDCDVNNQDGEIYHNLKLEDVVLLRVC